MNLEPLNITYLVTGAAGFIGMHTSLRLLARGDQVVGVDNLNDYYDVTLKEARLARLTSHPDFTFHKLDVADRQGMADLFAREKPQRVIHLAAQAGVRYSLTNPHAYIDANVQGFTNILEACRHNGIEHLAYASSSSVYGGNTKLPFSEHDNIDHPVSLYAATKKANELMAHTYSHLFRLPTTGLRFFTVYGPWGRPDMALFLFTKAILEGKPIDVFNHGKMVRDFTYIDDIVSGVLGAIDHCEGYEIYNLGESLTTTLEQLVENVGSALGREVVLDRQPMQPGDVVITYADISKARERLGYAPSTALPEGMLRFVDWYRTEGPGA